MKKNEFIKWLREIKGMSDSTINSRISNITRVDKAEGDLDIHYLKDKCENLLSRLEYSKINFDRKEQVRHSVIINGNPITGTATLKAAVKLYLEFCSYNNCENYNVVIKEQKKRVVQPIQQVDDNIEINDSYNNFLKKFNIVKSDFYKFGLEETIYPSGIKIEEYWNDLKSRVINNKPVFIRGYGRDAHGTELYKQIHFKIFGNENIQKDPTNNLRPQKIIEDLTGYKRNKNLFNYQVSHIFGMTKNALMFEAPWNIALVPKIIDPLTGHESKGEWAKEYQEMFLNNVIDKYERYIYEYNEIVCKYNFDNQIKEFVAEDAEKILSQYEDSQKKNKLYNDLSSDFKLIGR